MDRDDERDRRQLSTMDPIFNRQVEDVVARLIDKLHPLPTDDRIREIATQAARDLLGAIGLDVSSFKEQAKTAAEIDQWRTVNQTIGSVVKKVFLWVIGVVLSGLGIVGYMFSGRWK